MKSTILSCALIATLLFGCGTKDEKETSKKGEKTTEKEEKKEENNEEKEKTTQKTKKKKESWAGNYEFFDQEQKYQITLTIKSDNTFELGYSVFKGGFVLSGNLAIRGKEADLIFEEGSAVTPFDKDYKKGDIFGTISKNDESFDIDCSNFGEKRNLKKVDAFQELQ